MTAEPMLMGKMTGQRLTLAATGSWTAEHAYGLEPLVEAVTERPLTAVGVSIDMGRIERLDTFGAWLVERLLRAHGGPRVTRPTSSGFRITTAHCLKTHNVNRGAHLPPPSHRTAFDIIAKVMRLIERAAARRVHQVIDLTHTPPARGASAGPRHVRR